MPRRLASAASSRLTAKKAQLGELRFSQMDGFLFGATRIEGSAELSRKAPRRHDAPNDARPKRKPDFNSGPHTHIDRRFADGCVTKIRLVRASVELAVFHGY